MYETVTLNVSEDSEDKEFLKLYVHRPPQATKKSPVLLLHGGPGVPDYLAYIAEHLAGLDYVAVRYDQRGSGDSSRDDLVSVQTHIEDIEAIRGWLQAEKIYIFGHSWGGLLAQLYAKKHLHRVSRMLLASPSTGVGKVWSEMEGHVMAYNRKHAGIWGFLKMGIYSLGMMCLPGKFADGAMQMMMAMVWSNYFENRSTAPPADETWLSKVSSSAQIQTRNSIVAMDDDGDVYPTPSEINQNNIDVLILFGDRDIYGDFPKANYILRYGSSAKVLTVKNSGHVTWMEGKTQFGSILEQFFRIESS